MTQHFFASSVTVNNRLALLMSFAHRFSIQLEDNIRNASSAQHFREVTSVQPVAYDDDMITQVSPSRTSSPLSDSVLPFLNRPLLRA